jgi:hypothetical protein
VSVTFTTGVILTVEAAFGSVPLDTTPTWTDISAYVRTLRTDRGRGHSLDRVTAGRGSLLLDNTSGRFDPTYTSGPYYPNVQPMTPLRISVAYTVSDGMKLDTAGRGLGNPLQVGTAPQFTGYAESWNQTWPGDGVDAEVVVSLTDGMKLWNLFRTSGIPYGPDNTRSRIEEMLTDHGWPAEWIDAYAGVREASVTDSDDQPVLSDLQLVEGTEGGMLYVQPDGQAMFQHRNYRASLAAGVTFGDGAGEYPYTPATTIDLDDHQIWNEVRVTSKDGVSASASDATSISNFGHRVLTYNETLHTTGTAATAHAQSMRDRYKTPVPRLARITIHPQRSPAQLWPVVLSYDLSKKLVVKRRPPAGNLITLNCYIEGVTHEADATTRQWVTAWRLSQDA